MIKLEVYNDINSSKPVRETYYWTHKQFVKYLIRNTYKFLREISAYAIRLKLYGDVSSEEEEVRVWL